LWISSVPSCQKLNVNNFSSWTVGKDAGSSTCSS
jgi:hypothetical protein